VSRHLELWIEESRCTRCGACSALAPEVFDVRGASCRVARQPGARDRVAAEAARLICPTDAIHARAGDAPDADVEPDVEPGETPLFDTLAVGAESVRWGLGDLPWDEMDAARASPGLRAVVREMAFSESATYTATQRFLDALGEDVDFSRWVSVWFYEETRHPHVLLAWLVRLGERVPPDFVLRGRVSTPLMRSIVGTLVTNVVSEITAAQAYRYLARTSREPVLARIAALIAGDEARHAASFFRFARRELARERPRVGSFDRERARGLEVLGAWLGGAQQVTHPVQQMIERLDAAAPSEAFDLDFASIRLRVVRVVGLLLGMPLHRAEDVPRTLRELLASRSAGPASPP
jgi:ferredoxin/rubrerythrin